MGIDPSEIPGRIDDMSLRTGILPSEALNRYVPPEGFVSVSSDTKTEELRYGFRTANYSLLIHRGVGSEVVRMMPIAMVPAGPAWLRGIINLRGNLIPVCDLVRLLGQENDIAKRELMILVLDKGERAAGFLIDGHPHALTSLRPLNQIPVLPDLLSRYVEAAYSNENEIWLEFDYAGFLLEAD